MLCALIYIHDKHDELQPERKVKLRKGRRDCWKVLQEMEPDDTHIDLGYTTAEITKACSVLQTYKWIHRTQDSLETYEREARSVYSRLLIFGAGNASARLLFLMASRPSPNILQHMF